MVVVGLDPSRAAVELERLASPESAPSRAAARAAAVDVRPAGAAEAIAAALETSPPRAGSAGAA